MKPYLLALISSIGLVACAGLEGFQASYTFPKGSPGAGATVSVQNNQISASYDISSLFTKK